jgi:hypothetical protein
MGNQFRARFWPYKKYRCLHFQANNWQKNKLEKKGEDLIFLIVLLTKQSITAFPLVGVQK